MMGPKIVPILACGPCYWVGLTKYVDLHRCQYHLDNIGGIRCYSHIFVGNS